MLRRNKFIIVFSLLCSALILSSCCEEPTGASFGYSMTILQNPESIVQSDRIMVDEMTLNDEKRTFLYNAVCSLRNDDFPETIIKKKVTEWIYGGDFSFGFTVDKKLADKWDGVYFEDETKFDEERDAIYDNTSKYFIVINDPDLSGYDPNYETVKHYCHHNLETTIYLGAAKETE